LDVLAFMIGEQVRESPGAPAVPLHDWTRVDSGIFHSFHSAWVTHLKEILNGGMLPRDYYALAEQHGSLGVPEILTQHAPDTQSGRPPLSYTAMRRTLVVRHVSGHRLVAMIEIVSPGNKDRDTSVAQLAEKIESALRTGVHVLLVDLFRPGKYDPQGIHGATWSAFDAQEYDLPLDRSLTLASYLAGQIPEAFVEHIRFGEPLPEMPLFIEYLAHVNVPLEPTYSAAYRGMPEYYRAILERES
jgi:hypothetical protein